MKDVLPAWFGITYNGDICGLLCEECADKHPFPFELVKIQDVMGCLDRACCSCSLEVVETVYAKK